MWTKIIIIIFLLSISFDILSNLIVQNNDKSEVSIYDHPSAFSIYGISLNHLKRKISTSSLVTGTGIAFQLTYNLTKV